MIMIFGIFIIFYKLSYKCEYEIISKSCRDRYMEQMVIRDTDCNIKTIFKSCAEYGLDYECDPLSGHCIKTGSTIATTTIPAITPQNCEEKVLWSYCSNSQTLAFMNQRSDCSNYITTKTCGFDERCIFLSSSSAECQKIPEPKYDYIPPVPGQTLLNIEGCEYSSYKKYRTNEGYIIYYLTLTNPNTCLHPVYTDKKMGAWCLPSYSRTEMVITSNWVDLDSLFFWVYYEHEKCHLNLKEFAGTPEAEEELCTKESMDKVYWVYPYIPNPFYVKPILNEIK
jgi:hypothetical protein